MGREYLADHAYEIERGLPTPLDLTTTKPTMQISQVKQMPDKAPVLEPISGVLAEVYPAETKTVNFGNGDQQKTKQNAKLTQGNDFIYVEFSDFPQDMMAAKGQQVTLKSNNTGAHGWQGVKINKYTPRNGGNERCNLRVTPSATVTVGQPTYNTEGQQVQPSQPTQAYQAPQASTPTPPPQNASQGRTPFQGMTVGMAINNACKLIEGVEQPGTPEFSQLLHEVSSDIIRVSEYIADGNLAEHPRKRGQPVQQQVSTPPAYFPPTTQEVIQEDVPMGDDENCPF
jgi:hypothetical protein